MNANNPSIAGSRWPAILKKLKPRRTRRRLLSGEFVERSRGYYVEARLWVHVTGFAIVTLVSLVQRWGVGFAVAAIAGMAAVHAALRRHAEVGLVRYVLIDVTAMGLAMVFIGIPTVASVLAIVLTLMASLLLGRRESFFVAGYALTWAFLAYLFHDTVRRQPTGPWANPDPWIVSVTVFGVVMVLVVSRRVVDMIAELETVRAQFMSGVAHDLRTPLTGVIGTASMLRDMGSELTDEESAEFLDIVVRQAVDANRMVEDLLTSARIDADGIDLQKTPVDVVELIEETLRFAPTGERTSIVWARPDQPVVVEVDPTRMRQVIQNLVSNAVRYGDGEVEVRIGVDAGGVAVLVIDDGPGIADDDLQRVFEPFGRGSGGVKHSASIGLGLFVSRRLAQLMGGDLVYRRVDGKTVFEMRLPQ
ncbi:MAG: HAMP domain-containing sensor histidine kinase [Acidimicrobiia bacterium]|nr:HAMP domain-containing sensor histidine kinase [Acidimicrobiia bacterium]